MIIQDYHRIIDAVLTMNDSQQRFDASVYMGKSRLFGGTYITVFISDNSLNETILKALGKTNVVKSMIIGMDFEPTVDEAIEIIRQMTKDGQR